MRQFLFFGAMLACLLVVSRGAGASDGGDGYEDVETGEVLDVQVEPLVSFTIFEPEVIAMSSDANLKAFLDMVAYAEGTSGADGYRMHFGKSLFGSFADHPRVVKVATMFNKKTGVTKTYRSSAAGRYQIIADTWTDIQRALSLPDFTPESQDKAATWLIRRRGALADVQAGRFNDALYKCRKEWASLPGAGYDQPEKARDVLANVYTKAGGVIA